MPAAPAPSLLARFAERRLIAAFRRRDRAAFDTLFDRHGPQVFGFALQLTGCRSDAEDLTQETFLAAFQGASGFNGNARLSTWLLGIAARRWRDRGRAGQATMVPLWDEGDEGAPLPLVSPLSTERTALARVRYQAALATLPPDLREAWVLVVAEGLTHREAALVLETPEGTLKWRTAQATKRLRAALSEGEEHQP